MQQDMSDLNPSGVTGQPLDPFNMPRSPQWPEVQLISMLIFPRYAGKVKLST